jgi:hypothetical protein
MQYNMVAQRTFINNCAGRTAGRILWLQVLLSSCLCSGSRSSVYDQAVTTFSPKGELLQVQYAQVAADRGEPCVALCCKSGEIVICYPSAPSNSLLDQRISDKMGKVNDGIWTVFSGIAGDGLRILREARELSAAYESIYGSYPSVQYSAHKMGEMQHSATLKAGTSVFVMNNVPSNNFKDFRETAARCKRFVLRI